MRSVSPGHGHVKRCLGSGAHRHVDTRLVGSNSGQEKRSALFRAGPRTLQHNQRPAWSCPPTVPSTAWGADPRRYRPVSQGFLHGRAITVRVFLQTERPGPKPRPVALSYSLTSA